MPDDINSKFDTKASKKLVIKNSLSKKISSSISSKLRAKILEAKKNNDEESLKYIMDVLSSAHENDPSIRNNKGSIENVEEFIKEVVSEVVNGYKQIREDGYYIERMELIRDMVPYEFGEQFEFRRGINLLVGDQGCGKSTMLHMLMYHETEYKDIAKVEQNGFKGDYIFQDCEKHNPRNLAGESGGRSDVAAIREFFLYMKNNLSPGKEFLTEIENYMKSYLKSMGEDNINQTLISNFKSHGEVLLPMLEKFIKSKNGLIFIDEPETALSIRSQLKLVDILIKAADQKCQLFIATHSRILMESVGQVLSLEHRKWMDSEVFIKSQLTSK